MKHIIGQAIVSTLLLANPQLAHGKEYTVQMISSGEKGNYYFNPKKLHIKLGDTVTWVNMQDEGHDVMAERIPTNAENFVSPLLEKKGDKWSYTFKTSGTYLYHCHPHSQIMSGVIIVDRPSTSMQMHDVDDGHEHEHKNQHHH